jgi:hypothetical protein
VSLAKKLNLKPGMRLQVIGRPPTVDLGDVDATTGKGDGVLVFAATRADLDARRKPVVEAARADRLAWVAYPKAGQLGTDLNRDILWKQLEPRGVQPVRQVAIDDVWSALRFRVRTGED